MNLHIYKCVFLYIRMQCIYAWSSKCSYLENMVALTILYLRLCLFFDIFFVYIVYFIVWLSMILTRDRFVLWFVFEWSQSHVGLVLQVQAITGWIPKWTLVCRQ